MRCRLIDLGFIIIGLRLCMAEKVGVAGEPSMNVGANVQVSKARGTIAHAEVVIAADPIHPDHLLAASMAASQAATKDDQLWSRVIVYASSDGGQSWDVSFEPPAQADPALAFGPDGTAYLAAIAPQDQDFFKIQVFRLAARAKQWERIRGGDPIGMDRPYLTVSQAGPGRGTLYLNGTGGERTVRSNNRPAVYRLQDGLHFKLLQAWDPDHTQAADNGGNGTLAILSDGTVVVSYASAPLVDWKESIKPVLSAGWKVGSDPTGNEVMIRVRRIDAGSRLMEGQAPVQPHCLMSGRFPALASDASGGRYNDRLYLTWSQWDSVGRRVMVSRSEDKGAHWSEPVPLSEQPSAGAGYHAFLPEVAVNKAGMVAVSWYDTRERNRIGKPAWDVRLRVSSDGGQTWRPSVRVTSRTCVFTGEDPEQEHRRILRPLWLGDTAGLCADAAGVFHPLWIDNRTGERQVWTAAVRVGTE